MNLRYIKDINTHAKKNKIANVKKNYRIYFNNNI